MVPLMSPHTTRDAKAMKKLLFALACTTCCLALAACGDGTPAKKTVNAKPAASAPVAAPGEKFKNSIGSNSGGAGAPAGGKKESSDK